MDEHALVEAAKSYLDLYTNGRVPFRDNDGKVKFVVFAWLVEQWVFVEVEG